MTSGETAWLYRLGSGGSVDLLNPDATARFIGLTHQCYATVLSKHFGKAVRFMFTDEPSAGMPHPPNSIPWFPGMEQAYEAQCGHSFLADLPALFVEDDEGIPVAVARARVALYDVMTRRFADAYFEQLRGWGRSHALASGGHLDGDDETFGAVKYGYGHLLRQLRRMDLPGVDLIWRQLFPGREGQPNFPIAPASVAHQNGTRFALSESFCVYGNGLTPAQMKWLTDYQYIRGVNLLVLGCYPLSTRGHHMTGERPHFGWMNPLWDHLPGYHGYVARLGYALSVGKPLIRTALYYPARDMWAWGLGAKEAVESYEAIGRELMARQCPFDLIDDDVLSTAVVEGNELAVATHQLLMKTHLPFIGNIEGRDVLRGGADVVVCDGFTGNILLKFSESIIGWLTGLVRESVTASGVLSQVGPDVVGELFAKLRAQLDYAEYGGAPLLGVDGVCIIAHGSSSARAVKNAIRAAVRLVNNGLTPRIRTELAAMEGDAE